MPSQSALGRGLVLEMRPALSMSRSHLALKALEVVADSHGKGQQFFERLLWLVKGDGDTAGLQVDTRRQVHELLRQDLKRGLDEKLGPFEAILFELRQNLADVPAAAPFIVAVVAFGEASQMGDEGIAIGQTVGADTLGNAGSEDLLGSAAADAQEELYRRAIDEGARTGFDLAEYVVDFAIPEGFCRHGVTQVLNRGRPLVGLDRIREL